MAKGQDYERQICKQLSLWWSADWDVPDDNLCWRTANSGGRATVRRKAGKQDHRHCNDVAAIDERMAPFFRVVTVEVKRGYNRSTVIDLIDRPAKAKSKQPQYGEWFAKLTVAVRQAGTPHWLLVHRRDRREALVFFSDELMDELDASGKVLRPPRPIVMFLAHDWIERVVGATLADFLACYPPSAFERLAENVSGGNTPSA